MFQNLIKVIPSVILLSIPQASLASSLIERDVQECRIGSNLVVSTCDVYDTRTRDGFLDTRVIKPRTSNWVFKQKWVEGKGFVSCDNVSNKCYKYTYRVTNYGSQVAPWLIIKSVTWD